MGNFKEQRHATLPFLKIHTRHQDPTSSAPLTCRLGRLHHANPARFSPLYEVYQFMKLGVSQRVWVGRGGGGPDLDLKKKHTPI